MTVRFLLGRAGSGKTRACLDAIAAHSKREPTGPPLLFLVPEQATFQMEKELSLLCGGGSFRAQVMSFRRLAFRILRERSRQTPPLISEAGRKMVLRRLLQSHPERYRVFFRAARQPRFCDQAAAQLRELKNYRVGPSELRTAADRAGCGEILRGKLLDLAELSDAYAGYTAGKYLDPEDTMQLLAEEVDKGSLPPGTLVWVDGFAGFTPQEYTVLAALLKNAAHVEIALCLDPGNMSGEPAGDELFFPTLDTYRRLRRVCGEIGLKAYPPFLLPAEGGKTRFDGSPALSFLEKATACGSAVPYRETAADVTLAAAAGNRAEVEAVARDIIHNVREKGWRYREIAVVLRDISLYHDLVAAVFGDKGIPFFIDHRRSAAHHPLVELLRSALEAVITNLNPQTVFHMLKTDLLPLTRFEADRLENYVRAHGIRGARFLDPEPWEYVRRLSLDEESNGGSGGNSELAVVNAAKEKFRACFAPFARSLTGKREAAYFCETLWSFLSGIGAKATLCSWVSAGPETEGREHRQVWNEVVSLLDQIAGVLGGQVMTVSEFFQVFVSGLEGLTLGLVPAGLDQVTVGSVERSRQPYLRACYVLGLCEGEFPARPADEGLFADEERTALAEGGAELAVTKRQRLFHEQYLAYIALTRASEYLWASYPLADGEGKAKRPSSVFNRLKEIFPRNSVLFFGNLPEGKGDLHYVAHPLETAGLLLLQAGKAAGGGRLSPLWSAVYNEALACENARERMKMLWPSLTYSNIVPPLTPDSVEKLYGRSLSSSVSRLEMFARCPFSHFARYGLHLEERREFRVEAPDMGTFYHAALRAFVEELWSKEGDWGAMDGAAARLLMAEIVERLVPRLHREILLSSARLRFLASKLKENLCDAAERLTEHARLGRFRPVAVELSFGQGLLPAWEAGAPGGDIRIYGQIDRLDLAIHDGRAYFLVIDYKSNAMELRLSDVFHGIALQLPAYLAVIRENAVQFAKEEPCFAGAMYFAVNSSYTRLDNPPEGAVADEKAHRLDGIMLADSDVFTLMGGPSGLVRAALKSGGGFTKHSRVAAPEEMEGLLGFTEMKIREMCRAILAGRTDPNPYKKKNGQRACSCCPYPPLCRFDVTGGGNSYRNLAGMNHEEALAAICAAWKGGDDGAPLDG